eukprot:TRINITY_DN17137_c0_g1_i1.p1 TRINITY_DN17137_c0_g1~~TRINITY_DN17137_c0_g1_i1.p1  ORF type:complete len:273 (+),score=23.27 TRINITY_DN17137_c0_g1_i1:102-920(+)
METAFGADDLCRSHAGMCCKQCSKTCSNPNVQGRYASGWHQPVGGSGWRGPAWYCRDCWWAWRPTLIVGITGATGSGKSTLATSVCDALQSRAPDPVASETVQQDFHRRYEQFWVAVGSLHLPDWEPAERSDWESLLISIEEAAARSRVVLVEGYCLLHDDRVWSLLDKVIWLEVDQDTCCDRRDKWPTEWSTKKAYFEQCIWPAHQRYKASVFQRSSDRQESGDKRIALHMTATESIDKLASNLVEHVLAWLHEQEQMYSKGLHEENSRAT